MKAIDVERTVLLTLVMLVLAVLTVISSLAVGFFALPAFVGGAAWLLFYWALRHQGRRNPLSPLDIGPTQKWADGQPLDRSLEHQTQQRAAQDALRADDEDFEKRHQLEEAEREEFRKHVDPRDFEGPPPRVPFP